MGAGYNLLSGKGSSISASATHNIKIQSNEPSSTEGLWVQADISPSIIQEVTINDIKQLFTGWSTVTLPEGYSSFAIVGDYMYLIGNSNGIYAKTYLKTTPYAFTYHSANSSLIFTNTAVIGSIIYATTEGSSMNVYQMDTSVETPIFQLILPEVLSYPNPRICSYGTKLYSMKGGTGTQTAMVIDTADSNPSWQALASLSEDSTKCSIMVLNDILYVIGIMSNGYKCYGLDLRITPYAFQIVTSFVSQGTYYASLSDVGGILRIINCGFVTNDRNTLSLIDGIWQKAAQTGLTQLTINSASNTSAYYTDYALYIKDKFNDDMYILGIKYPLLNYPDNTLILVKGNSNNKVITASIDNYIVEDDVSSCYLLNIIGEEQVLTRIPIAIHNGAEWKEI